MLLLPVLGQAQEFKGGLSLSMMSSVFVGVGTEPDIYLDGVGGAFLELRSVWGVRGTVQYFRQRGTVKEVGEASAYKTSAEVCARRYFGGKQDNKMEWYVGLGVNVPIAIHRESIEQTSQDWASMIEFGVTHRRWSGGLFFVTSHELKDNLPTIYGFQHWAKLGLKADYALFK